MEKRIVAAAYPDDFFSINRKIFKLNGMWKPVAHMNKAQRLLYRFYGIVFMFLYSVVLYTLTELMSLVDTFHDEEKFVKNLSYIVTHTMGLIKLLFWYTQSNRLLEIMQKLDDKTYLYEDYKDFKPGHIMQKYKDTGYKLNIILPSCVICIVIPLYVPPIYWTVRYMMEPGNSTRKLPEHLPCSSWVPLKLDSGGLFLSALLFQLCALVGQGFIISAVDGLFMNLMNCIRAHLDVIQGAFLTIKGRCEVRCTGPLSTPDGLNNSSMLNDIMNKEIKKIIDHLQSIFGVCKKLEHLFTYPTLAQTLATLIILCTCLYLVSSVPIGTLQFYSEMFYIVGMGFQIVTYCYFGNEITLKCSELPSCLWKMNWLGTDASFKKLMLFTMMRSKKPLYLSAGKFVPLNLATFMAIVKFSYSVFALIKNFSI